MDISPRYTPFLCNHCFKWNTEYDYPDPRCYKCHRAKAETCFPARVLLLRDQYFFTINEWHEHAQFPIMRREALRILQDAYDQAIAQEIKEQHQLQTVKGKIKHFFKRDHRAQNEEENIHVAYVIRKMEIQSRPEPKPFLNGIQVDKVVTLFRRVTDRNWQIKLSVLIAFAKVDIPCLEKQNTRLADRLATLLAFLQDLGDIPTHNEVVIELDTRQLISVEACIEGLQSGQIPFEGGDVAEVISRFATATGRIMTAEECQRHGWISN